MQCFTLRYSLQARLENIDNPGWYLEISLEKSDLSNESFKVVKIDRTEDDWVHCLVRNGVLIGAGGPKNLGDICQLFCNWVESVDKSFIDPKSTGEAFKDTGVSEWMEDWYSKHCDGDWEHDAGFTIKNIDGNQWAFKLVLLGTAGEGEILSSKLTKRSSSDWYRYYSDGDKFYGEGGGSNLVDIISEFKEWITQLDEMYEIEFVDTD